MREQTKKLNKLLAEYKKLKYEIFGNDAKFAVLDENNPKVKALAKRYDQLFQLFYPQYRTKHWINPLTH